MRHKVLLLLEKSNQFQAGYDEAKVLRVYEEQDFVRAEEDLQMLQLTKPQSSVQLVDPQFIASSSLNFAIDSSAYQGVKVVPLGDKMVCAREENPIL